MVIDFDNCVSSKICDQAITLLDGLWVSYKQILTCTGQLGVDFAELKELLDSLSVIREGGGNDDVQ